jgi:hypothetical protein
VAAVPHGGSQNRCRCLASSAASCASSPTPRCSSSSSTEVPGREALLARGRREPDPAAGVAIEEASRHGVQESCSAWRTAAASTCSPT